MIITTLPTKKAISEIVKAYRILQSPNKKPLSLRKFAAGLNRGGVSFSHQSIKNWQDRKHLPHIFYMQHLIKNTSDWRHDFARDILSVLLPDIYLPATEIAKHANPQTD